MKQVDIKKALGAYFEMVELGQSMMIDSLVEQGFTLQQAKEEYARLHKRHFVKGDDPDLIERALKAGIWRKR